MCTKRLGMGDTEDLLQVGEQRFPDADRIVNAVGVEEFPSLFAACSKGLYFVLCHGLVLLDGFVSIMWHRRLARFFGHDG